MKRFFTWTLAVLSLCAGFASCSDDEEEVIPELIVNTPTLSVAGTGGAFEVPILTSGLALDETVEVSADVDWVTNLQATSQSFSFEVSKAPLDVESRTATFTLSLSQHAAIKATCTLTQGKNHEEFYIQMDELRGTSAIYTVVPSASQSEGDFISYCFSSDELAQYSSATEVKDAICAKQEAKAKEMKEKYDTYISSTLSWRSREGSESTQELVRDLEPAKEYTIVAFGYTGDPYGTAEEMKATTELVKYTFVTPDDVPEVTPTTLDVKANVRGALYDVDITSSRADVYLRCLINAKSSYESNYPTDEAFILAQLYYYYSGASYSMIIRSMQKDRLQMTGRRISNNTEGIACAVAFDSHLNLLCQPTKTTFTVGEPEPSDNVLTITVTDVKARRVDFKVNGSNSDPFRYMLKGKSTVEKIMGDGTDEEKEEKLAKYVQQNGFIDQKEGSTWYSTWPTTDFVILAVGVAGYYEDEKPTTKVFMQEVSTPEATIGTATCTFDIVKSFDSVEFKEAFDWYGWTGYLTTAFTFTQSDDAEQIFYAYESLSSYNACQSELEAEGRSERFLDWQYMNLETGSEFKKLGAIISKEGKDMMFFAAAKDKNGNFGPIAHFTIECDKMPISPISEISVFNPNGGNAETKSIGLPEGLKGAKPQQPEEQPARTALEELRCVRMQ